MADSQVMNSGKERSSVLESLLLLGFCFLMGLAALGVCAYVGVTGSLFTLDGLLLIVICLSVGGIFMLVVGWSAYTGELQALLKELRKKPASGEPSDNTA